MPVHDKPKKQIESDCRAALIPQEVVERYPELTKSLGALANWRT